MGPTPADSEPYERDVHVPQPDHARGCRLVEDLGTEAVRLGQIAGLSTQAQLGIVDGSSIGIDDPDSDVGHDGDGIVGLKQFDWRESACPVGRRLIWTGYVGPRTYRRGDGTRPRSSPTPPAGSTSTSRTSTRS